MNFNDMKVKRLFDIPYYQLSEFPQQDALAAKENGRWKKYSTQQFIEIVNKVSLSLLAAGIKKDDKIAIVANNRPEWNFIDLGVLQIGAVNVPVYPTISEEEYQFIFNDAAIKLAFVSDEGLYTKLTHIKEEIPSLDAIYTFDKVAGAKRWTDFLSLAEGQRPEELKAVSDKIKAEDLATLIYTSGTTGTPKGVMLSHNNMLSNVLACLPVFPLNETHRGFSFLPLNHVFERMVTYAYMMKGISIYYAENMDTIADNLKEVKPHVFTTVPRLLEKVYDKIYAKGMALTGIKKKLFFWALNLGLLYDHEGKSWWYHLQLKLANTLIFSKWREALGGNIIMIVSGGAALQPRLARVFTAGKIPALEGYGLTETSPVIAVNCLPKGEKKFGTVGTVVSGVTVKIAEDGEILCKGPNIMMGYYNRDDLTKEVIDKDGWFHTGDIGCLVDDKFLKITDRKKEIFKTSGGKYCAPQPIENKFKESIFIEQIMVVGEGRKFISALIVPALPNLQGWCTVKNIPWTNSRDIIKLPAVVAKYDKIVDELNKDFGHTEQIKQFKLVPDEWSVETGELTPTMKLKRKIILEKYKDIIEKIYN